MSPRYRRWKRDVTLWVERVDAARRGILLDALGRHGGNRTAVARELGLERTHVQRLVRELLTEEERRIR